MDHAQYRSDEEIAAFVGNPLISALRESYSPEDTIRHLTLRLEYDNSERLKRTDVRLRSCMQIRHFFQPDRNTLTAAMQIDSCLRWGYVSRNPILSTTVQYENCLLNAGTALYRSASGFTILGISGCGKTTNLEMILHTYPQVIRHTRYQGRPFVGIQVVWLKIEMAADASLKGLFRNFMTALDNALNNETHYSDQYDSARYSKDQLFNAVRKLVIKYHIGILVIDELQQLCLSKGNVSQIILNFFVTLVNTIGVPVVTCGTGKARQLFRNEFQQARRGSGIGEIIWTRMDGDERWDRFAKSMWRYQYTQEIVEQTSEMNAVFLEQTLGIPYIAVHLYDLVQQDAIISGRESFSVEDIRRVAAEKMLLTREILEKLGKGIDVDLEKDLDVSPFAYYPTQEETIDIGTDQVSPESTPQLKRETAIEQATFLLADILQKDSSKVRRFVHLAAANHDSAVSYQTLFREAYELYGKETASPRQQDSGVPFPDAKGYDDLKKLDLVEGEAGMTFDE